MQKIILSVLVMSILVSCKNEQKGSGSFTVSGMLSNAPSKIIYIEETNIATGEKKVKNSADIGAEGKFTMKVDGVNEAAYNLRFSTDPSPFATIINDASKINVEVDFNKRYDFYKVSGSKASQSIQEFLAKVNEILNQKLNS